MARSGTALLFLGKEGDASNVELCSMASTAINNDETSGSTTCVSVTRLRSLSSVWNAISSGCCQQEHAGKTNLLSLHQAAPRSQGFGGTLTQTCSDDVDFRRTGIETVVHKKTGIVCNDIAASSVHAAETRHFNMAVHWTDGVLLRIVLNKPKYLAEDGTSPFNSHPQN
jgi:hypothetical protein